MGQAVDVKQAELVLERAAGKAAARDEPVDPLWEQRIWQMEEWPSNRVAIAVVGTALLAKATNSAIDPLSLSEKSGPNGYAPRALARALIAGKRDAYGYSLGTNGPDPLAGSPWFGDVLRIDLIGKWRPNMRKRLDLMITWLANLTAGDAEDALVAFLRVRMDVFADRAQLKVLSEVDAANVTYKDVTDTLRAFIEIDPEDGRRGAAATAATFAAAGWEVVARPVNDPGQIDVDVMLEDVLVIGIEVKQKPATAQDALDIAEAVASAEASKALLCALDPRQAPLDDEGLISRADAELGVALEIAYSVNELTRIALFSSPVSRDDFVASLPVHMAKFLDVLDVSQEARERWKATADRWAE